MIHVKKLNESRASIPTPRDFIRMMIKKTNDMQFPKQNLFMISFREKEVMKVCVRLISIFLSIKHTRRDVSLIKKEFVHYHKNVFS